MSRKHVEEYVLKIMKTLLTNDSNWKIYKERMAEMKDPEFKTWVEALISRKTKLAAYLPNDGTAVNIEKCFAFAREHKYEFFQRIEIAETPTIPRHMSAAKHLIVQCPVRRQSQTFSKKISVAKHDRTVDALTGQAVGDSETSTMSAPENRILVGIGLKYTAREYNKIAGGDVGSYKAYKYFLENAGSVTQAEIEQYSTGVGSVKVLKSWLRSKHIDSTL